MTNDLLARIKDVREEYNKSVRFDIKDGKHIISVPEFVSLKISELLSDLQTLFENPPEQVKEALYIANDGLHWAEGEHKAIPHTNLQLMSIRIDYYRLEIIRTALLALTAENKEKDKVIELLKQEVDYWRV